MYKICKTDESFSRQRSFESCLLKSMETIPYLDISISDLCRQVGIARKNFYRYFDNKDDVLCALIDHIILDFSRFENEETTPSAAAPMVVIQFLTYWQQQKPLLDALRNNGMSTRLIERVLVHAWQRDTGFLQLLGNNADQSTVLFAVSGIISLIITWHHLGFRQSKEELAADIYRLMTQPIVSITK